MTRPWYVRDPIGLEEVRREVEDAYPDLRFTQRDYGVVLRGYYPLSEGNRVLDRYLVEVQPNRDVRRGLPTVREVGGRIPQSPERHVSHDGTACITLPDAFWFQYPKGLSLREFLDGPMRGYFAAQSLIARGVPEAWGHGEWDHGGLGIVGFYEERLGLSDPFVIGRFLKLVTAKAIKGHWACPCGKGARLRECHGPLVHELRARIPRDVATRSEEELSRFLREMTNQGGDSIKKR